MPRRARSMASSFRLLPAAACTERRCWLVRPALLNKSHPSTSGRTSGSCSSCASHSCTSSRALAESSLSESFRVRRFRALLSSCSSTSSSRSPSGAGPIVTWSSSSATWVSAWGSSSVARLALRAGDEAAEGSELDLGPDLAFSPVLVLTRDRATWR